MNRIGSAVMVLVGMSTAAWTVDTETLTSDEAARALRQAVTFFRQDVSAHGGYLWRYSADLNRREGEGNAGPLTIWVQPPGTPSVGSAYLTVYEQTRDPFYLEAARETAHALVNGQLRSGGWGYQIEFDPEKRKHWAYRVDGKKAGPWNVSTLDDDTTQSALRFLMRVDQTLDFEDASIHEAALYALDHLLGAQYPNGAWPQRFSGPPDPERYPVKPASYPDTWSRTFPKQDYTGYYTFNDNTLGDAIKTMFDAYEVYKDERYKAAAKKAGDFILLAQMPDPQPGWAQQYDADMHPAWARKFEPPAVTGGESQSVMRTLMFLYRETADRRYLEPLPRALAYYRRSLLPDGRLARFYELQSNTPLFFTKTYEMTYNSADMPTHYSFIVGSNLDAIQAEYERTEKADPASFAATNKREYRMTTKLAERAQAVAAGLDARGAWVEDGKLRYQDADDTTTRIIDCTTFAANIRLLGEFIAASRR